MRRFGIASMVLALAACGGGGPGSDGGPGADDGGPPPPEDGGPSTPSCSSAGTFDGPPNELTGLVGEEEGGVFVPFVEDRQARFEYGFQGGSMILPVIGVPLSIAGDEGCFFVTLTHYPDPDAPEAYGDVGRFPQLRRELRTTVDGDVAYTMPIFDQIGEGSLEGVRFLLEATVVGESFAVTETVPVEVIGDTPPACLALETTGGGGTCAYREVPGEGVVLSMEPYEPTPGTTSCPDPQDVRVRFEPTDPDTAICYEDVVSDPVTSVVIGPYELLPPASCLGDVTVGSRLPMTLLVIDGGTCVPYDYRFDLPECEAACPTP